MTRIDLNLFQVFSAVYVEGSVTRAARSLNLTQSAISHALVRLRNLYRDPLFVRHGKVMTPTPFARALFGQVRQSLQTLTESVARVRNFNPAETRRVFNISFRDVLESTFLPELIRRISAEAPLAQIASVRTGRLEAELDLAGGALDFVFDVALPLPASVRRKRLFSDSSVVVAREDHPALKNGLDLETYLALPHVLVSSRRSGLGLEDAALAQKGLQRQIVLRCQQYFAACTAVNITDMLLTMPEKYARSANRNLGNRIHRSPLDMPPLDIFLYWHESAESDPANIWLRNLLCAVAEDSVG